MWPRIGGLRSLALGTPGELRATLNTLVLAGVKTATAGRLAYYAEEGEELEQVGERLALVDDDDALAGVVEITGVEVVRFADVPWDFARAEGEGDRSIEEWRAGHSAYWARLGTPVESDSPIVCLRFRLVSGGEGGVASGDLGT
ncbi:ASCH domain-containing protein [Micromonospora sp. NPDC049230]|uniref:ASCH domain-containing protein n=1 Tax=Micromonospora sp. NPDC049230 TaxID=3155502 RepID=UPI0033D0AE50